MLFVHIKVFSINFFVSLSFYFRDSSLIWFISKITEYDISSDFFTMDSLKPIRCLKMENLISMLQNIGLNFNFLYFVIQSSKESIIDSISLIHHNDISDEVCLC